LKDHTAPLYLRSPVLKAMLSNDMLERKTGRIEIPDVKLKTLQDFVRFLYDDRMEPDADNVGLLALADKYSIQVLLSIHKNSKKYIFSL
jgi:hypothetical protein